jgi:hypothetical protein
VASSVATVRGGPSRRPAYSELHIGDFSGGLNVRDALTELAPNESPDCMNIVLDEKGGAAKRLGKSKWNGTVTASPITAGYESDACNCILWYTQADGKLYRDSGGTLTLVKTFGPDGRVQMTDFAGSCYLTHSFDGLFSSTDGTTWALAPVVRGTVPSGDLIATWQNRIWIASSNTNLLSFCAAGDPTNWEQAADSDAGFNYIREGNDFPIVCLFGTSGVDVQAQPALLVGKRSGAQGSIHRVVDAGTGNYVTLDSGVGPAGPNAITGLYGQLYIVSTAGLFATNGQGPLIPMGSKLNRLFDPDSIDYSKAPGFVANRTKDRVRFHVTRKGANGNDLCLEYHPIFQAFTAREDAVTVAVLHAQQEDIVLGASAAVPGQIYQHDVGGADDGQPISSWIYTRVFEPSGGYDQRLQHIRVLGRGHMTCESIADFARSGKAKDLAMVAEGFQWDFDGWDDPAVGWGEDLIEGWDDFWPRQLGRSFQLKFSETGTGTASTPPLLGDGASLTIGSWAIYSTKLTFSALAPIL